MRFEAFNYVECSLPEEMTIDEYRRTRPSSRTRRRMPRLLGRTG